MYGREEILKSKLKVIRIKASKTIRQGRSRIQWTTFWYKKRFRNSEKNEEKEDGS